MEEVLRMEKNDFWKGAALCVVSALAWAISGPLSRLSFAEGVTPATVAFWRVAISGACFLVHAAALGQLRPQRRDLGAMLAFGLFNVPVFFLSFQVCIEKSGSAMAVVLMFTAPVWVALFSRVLFHESIGRRKLLPMAVAFAGVALICLSGGSMGGDVSWMGIGSGIVCGLFYAGHFVFFGWWRRRYSSAAMFAMTFIPAAAVLAFFADPGPISALGWVGIAVPAVISTYGAYYLYGQSLLILTPVQAAIIGNIEPVAATMLAWWFWDENFTVCGWAGSILVLGAVAAMTLSRGRGA